MDTDPEQGVPLSSINDPANVSKIETPVGKSIDEAKNNGYDNISNYDDTNSQQPMNASLRIDKNANDVESSDKPDFLDDDDDVFAVDLNEDCWCPWFSCGCNCQFSLTMATIVAAILAAIIGIIIQTQLNGASLDENWMKIIEFPGKLWIRALKLLVLPLITLMMLILPSRVDKIGRIGRIGLPFFFLTSFCAAVQGTIWVNIIRPGRFGNEPAIAPNEDVEDAAQITVLDTILAIFENAVPDNIVVAMASLKVLGLITVFLMYGILLRKAKPEDASVVIKGARALLKCTMLAVAVVVWLTPIGMFSMVLVKITATADFFGLLHALGMYVVTALIGHSIHILIVLPLFVLAVAKVNPWVHLYKIIGAPMTAFATSSSAATLPRSIECAEKAGVSKDVLQFILPLGSAINMDGTAQGFPIMIMFIAQLYGRMDSITAADQILIMVMSIVISVGTAPVPNAGMVYLIMLLDIAGMSDMAPVAISTLFILDWFIDRIETAVNVTSDQYICKMVDAIEERNRKKHDGSSDPSEMR